MVRGPMRALLVVLSAALVACWQPPELVEPPVEPAVAPSAAELLAARPYTVTEPTGYTEAQEWPLVVLLHDAGSSGAATTTWLGLGAAVRGKAFFVAPDGTYDKSMKRGWRFSPVHADPWDVEYLLAVIHDIESKYRIDRARVFLVGYSQGANMAYRVACDAADDVAAVVGIAAEARYCHPTRPVSVLQVHGTGDDVVGYYGDDRIPPDPNTPSAHQSVRLWAERNTCSTTITRSTTTLDLVVDLDGAETIVETFPDCPTGIAVELWSMVDALHVPAWTSDVSARLYDFLAAHPRP